MFLPGRKPGSILWKWYEWSILIIDIIRKLFFFLEKTPIKYFFFFGFPGIVEPGEDCDCGSHVKCQRMLKDYESACCGEGDTLMYVNMSNVTNELCNQYCI